MSDQAESPGRESILSPISIEYIKAIPRTEMIEFKCPFCDRTIKVPESAIGKRGTCKTCNNRVVIQGPNKDSNESPQPATPTPPPLPDSRKPMRSKRRSGVLWVLAAIATFTVLTVDYYSKTDREYWTSEDGLTEYTDEYSRWSKKITHRHLTTNNAQGKPIYWTDGPMSASGKPHGEWSWFSMDTLKSEKLYYWYGDRISEGEFRLRESR